MLAELEVAPPPGCRAAEEIRQSASEGAKVDYLLGDLTSFKWVQATGLA